MRAGRGAGLVKLSYALMLTELDSHYATYTQPDTEERYALTVQDWIQLDRPVRITVTVEKL